MNGAGGIVRDQAAAGRAVATSNKVVLNDRSIREPKIDRVFLMLRVKIKRAVRAGESIVVLQRDGTAPSSCTALPTLKVLPSRRICCVISWSQGEVSDDGHIPRIQVLHIGPGVGESVP